MLLFSPIIPGLPIASLINKIKIMSKLLPNVLKRMYCYSLDVHRY
jgi:hypothetical protein